CQAEDGIRHFHVTGVQTCALPIYEAPQINHSISISGGSENFKARASVRVQDQDVIIANTNAKTSDFRLNTDFKVSSRINIATDLNYRDQNTLEPHSINVVFRRLMQNSIWAVPRCTNGAYGGGTQGNNPLLLAENGGTNRDISNYVTGSMTGTLQILEGLSFSTQVAFRTNDVTGKDFVNTWQTRDSTVVKKSNL